MWLTDRRWRKRMETERCIFCEEPIVEGDRRFPIGVMRLENEEPRIGVGHVHRECMMRQTLGGVGHHLGKCHCPGGSGEFEDPPEMTKREAAIAAVQVWESRRHGRGN
jgi:hypothetical protein